MNLDNRFWKSSFCLRFSHAFRLCCLIKPNMHVSDIHLLSVLSRSNITFQRTDILHPSSLGFEESRVHYSHVCVFFSWQHLFNYHIRLVSVHSTNHINAHKLLLNSTNRTLSHFLQNELLRCNLFYRNVLHFRANNASR